MDIKNDVPATPKEFSPGGSYRIGAETKAPAQELGACVMREKYWDEKTDSEKIAALAEQVEHLTHLVHDQAEQIDLLRLHSHAEDGTLTAKLDAVAPRSPRYDMGRKSYPINPLRRERR